MKKLFLSVILCLLSFFGFSQNGGQFFENNVVLIRVIGYDNGNYIFTVKNKQSCPVVIRTKADTDPAIDHNIGPNDSIWVLVPRPPLTEIKFRAKAETSCVSNPDMGFLEIIISLGVLSLENRPGIVFIRENHQYKVFFDKGFLNFDFGSLTENVNISVFDNNGRLTYSQISQVKKNLSLNTNLFLSKGLNYVRVYVQNKFYDYYTFKIFKN